MRAKKLLALALAGMALTTCLSGCDRTIIEHQFHTDTVTDVEYIIENTGTNLDGVYNLRKYFLPRGISVQTVLYSLYIVESDEDDFSEFFEEIDDVPELAEVQKFLTARDSRMYYVAKCDEDPASWWTAYSKAAKMFYDLFMQVEDENWTDKINNDPDACFFGLLGHPYKQGNEYYMVTIVYNAFSER